MYCSQCITQWIQSKNNASSCPACREPLSLSDLTQASRTVRNMLDKLRVKCKRCGQTELQRCDYFTNHIRTGCPKADIPCLASDIMCPWHGPRDALSSHLETCHFEPLRHVLISLITRNHQLEGQAAEQKTVIDGYEREIQKWDDECKQQQCEIARLRTRNRRQQEKPVVPNHWDSQLEASTTEDKPAAASEKYLRC